MNMVVLESLGSDIGGFGGYLLVMVVDALAEMTGQSANCRVASEILTV